MLDVLNALSQGGAVARLGDDDGGRVFDPRRNRAEHLLDPLSTGAVLFHRPDFKGAAGALREETLWLLGTNAASRYDALGSTPGAMKSSALDASGIHLMTSAEGPAQQMTIDAGPLGTGRGGHGHADALSVHLAFGGREWLIDPGTGAYVDDRGDRDRFRETHAHNTLEVDGRSQAQPAGPFAWRDLPTVRVERWLTGETFDLFIGSHAGYSRPDSPITHRRWIFNLKSRLWLVFDEAAGTGAHDLRLHWRFAPDLRLQTIGDLTLASAEDGMSLGVWAATADREWSRELVLDWQSPAYGRKESSALLRFAIRRELPAALATLLQPAAAGGARTGRFTALKREPDGPVAAFRYDTPSASHHFFFAPTGTRWELGPCTSDCRFVYAGIAAEGEQYHLVLCDGSWLAVDGTAVLRGGEPVSRCEVVSEAGAARVFGSRRSDIQAPSRLGIWVGGEATGSIGR